MIWAEFQVEKKAYKALWKRIKEGATGPMAAFLEKSYIVVSCGWQFDMDDEIMAVAKSCPGFFIDLEAIQEMIEIDKEMQKLSPILRRETRNDHERTEQRKAEGQSRSLMKEWDSYKPHQLEVSESWRIEMRFPYIDMDLIQELKHAPYCDQEKTMMRRASIAVVLRKDPLYESKNTTAV
ncbi:MAG: hypothetical protein WCI27_05390 [Candidatus Omnitrophota bacterium]